jgi:hypothetical protein
MQGLLLTLLIAPFTLSLGRTLRSFWCFALVFAIDKHRYVFPPEVLRRISSRITNEVAGINRVTYDISSKPPAVSSFVSLINYQLIAYCIRLWSGYNR